MIGEFDRQDRKISFCTKHEVTVSGGSRQCGLDRCANGDWALCFRGRQVGGWTEGLKDSGSAHFREPETTRCLAPIVLLFRRAVNPLGRWSNPIAMILPCHS